jgi:hypothetical protein
MSIRVNRMAMRFTVGVDFLQRQLRKADIAE